ncbi:MAG: hypothetical protein QOH76_787 [Thermoleophilaceae bacterium]|nr:hypothetical protein [Thermoleophilaceae bacterium]
MVPLRAKTAAGRKAPVDLTLRRSGRFLVTRNSPVPAQLPLRLRDGARLGHSGVGITPLVSNASATGRLVEGKLFYANVDRDTDQLIEPRPGGLESFTQLRSAASPEILSFQLSLPAGASAQRRSDGRAIDVTRAGRRVATVGAPAAVDADGRPVEASYSLTGNTIVVDVAHRQGDYRYPVLVDPSLTEQYDFRSSNPSLNTATGWTWFVFGHPNVFQWTASGPEGSGLYSYVPQGVQFYGPGNGFAYGDQGNFYWAAPTGSSIFRVDSTASTLQYFDFLALARKIWNPSNNTTPPGQPKIDTFVNYTNNTITLCADGSPGTGGCPNQTAGLDANQFWFSFYATKTGIDNLATPYGYLSAANIYIYDGNAPTVTSVSASETNGAWRGNDPVAQFTVSATDSGLGLADVKAVSSDNRVNVQSSAPCNGHRDSRCPTSAPSSSPNWPASLTYNTSALNEGVTPMSATAGDATGNRSSPYNWDVKVDRSAPTLAASGSLWDRRNQATDHRSEGLYAASYSTSVTATDGALTSNATKRSGVADIRMQLINSSGTVVADSVDPSPQGCPGSSCPKTRPWTINTDTYPDGDYTVKAIATDQVGRAGTLTWSVTIDRRGDIYNAKQYTGDPATGEDLVDEQWGRIGTHIGRTEDGDSVTTRQTVTCPPVVTGSATCDEYRVLVKNSAAGQGEQDSYDKETGMSTTDPGLPEGAEILKHLPSNLTPVSTGPLVDALQPWQTAPPDAGTTYAEYNFTSTDDDIGDESPATVTVKVWIDSKTTMPLKSVMTDTTGATLDASYFTYGRSRLLTTEVPADFFAVPPPGSPGYTQDVQHLGNGPLGTVTDVETASGFSPYYAGPTTALAGGKTFCLGSTDVVHFNQKLPPDITVPDPDPDALAAPPGDAQTMIDANYSTVGPGETCTPGADTAESPTLEVLSYANGSTTAQNWLDAYSSAAQEIALDPNDPDFTDSGPVPIVLPPTTAYVLAEGDGGTVTALVQLGGTTVILQGDFGKADVPLLVQRLVPR